LGALGTTVLAFEARDFVFEALHLGGQLEDRGDALLTEGEQAREQLSELRLGELVRIQLRFGKGFKRRLRGSRCPI
jgi:hypothetical protein